MRFRAFHHKQGSRLGNQPCDDNREAIGYAESCIAWPLPFRRYAPTFKSNCREINIEGRIDPDFYSRNEGRQPSFGLFQQALTFGRWML
ncbi:hypothetical protein ACM42_16710 [Bradyrhizobium sp. CCBAU 25338]|nr:hypothetical protein [Bradyrhizobium sp. CCBAU 25338]